MKRWLCVLMFVLLGLLAVSACAEELGTMQVVNCQEWVSLRETPSTSAARLYKVPLGALVTDCAEAQNGFIECAYLGRTGFVQAKYLKKVEDFSLLPARMTYEQFAGVGEPVTEIYESIGDSNSVSVRKSVTDGMEVMCAAVFSGDMQYLGRMSARMPADGQTSRLDAFAGGTEERRFLVWFANDRLSLYAIGRDIANGIVWSVPFRSSGIAHGVDEDGTIYVIGYFQDTLTCISPDGRILWQTQHEDPDIYWPYEVNVAEDDYVEVTYEEGGDQGEVTLRYRKSDGAILGSSGEGSGGAPAGNEDIRVEYAAATPIGAVYADVSVEDEPQARILFTPSAELTHFQLLSVSLAGFDDNGEQWEAEPVYTLESLTPESPLLASVTFIGDMPNNGFSYIDAQGERRSWILDMSGEDGSLVIWEFDAE